ncbi:hypothetical protein TSUD_145810 [Trifolium subterraneum]|uniref:Uncharacterized protein n=1 Tax=Trifolium subterraneum TaxID=3900 RepID=A0A2Z6N2R8_TRISU|nr:hypothetical protein TSUD_145810 [Trifolium subterraneum]
MSARETAASKPKQAVNRKHNLANHNNVRSEPYVSSISMIEARQTSMVVDSCDTTYRDDQNLCYFKITRNNQEHGGGKTMMTDRTVMPQPDVQEIVEKLGRNHESCVPNSTITNDFIFKKLSPR